MGIRAHNLFRYMRADEVAECIDGVTAVPGLYAKLWANIIPQRNTPGLNYREINDDFTRTALVNRWSKFTPEEQAKLNELAMIHEGWTKTDFGWAKYNN